MMNYCVQEGGQVAVNLHRDNSRFKFFHDNGKPVLADDCGGELSTVPVLHLIRQRGTAHA